MKLDPCENEVLYYYWRAYGSNYPILYKCTKEEYNTNKDVYNGSGIAGKISGKYNGIYFNYNKGFTYTDITIPTLTYCHDTYYYYYGESTYGKMAKAIGSKDISAGDLKQYLN